MVDAAFNISRICNMSHTFYPPSQAADKNDKNLFRSGWQQAVPTVRSLGCGGQCTTRSNNLMIMIIMMIMIMTMSMMLMMMVECCSFA